MSEVEIEGSLRRAEGWQERASGAAGALPLFYRRLNRHPYIIPICLLNLRYD